MPDNEPQRAAAASHDATVAEQEVERIKAWYAEELRGGRLPDLRPTLQRYPQYAEELQAFAAYMQAIAIDLPEPDPLPGAALSPAAQRALAQIRGASVVAGAAATAPADQSLLSRAFNKMGMRPNAFAAKIGLNRDLLTRLEHGLIAPASIPEALVRRIAAALDESPALVESLLGRQAPATSGFFYAETQPEQRQEGFLDAVEQSDLPTEQKQEWRDVIARERGGA